MGDPRKEERLSEVKWISTSRIAEVLDAEEAEWTEMRDLEDAATPGAVAADTRIRHRAVGAIDGVQAIRAALLGPTEELDG